MKPQLFGFTSYFVSWLVAAIVGVVLATLHARRAKFPLFKSLVAACAGALIILLGSKLLFLAEHQLFPWDSPAHLGHAPLRQLVRNGFRIPGGILLLTLAFPLICRGLRLRTLRFIDATFPAVGVAIVFIRTGCFLNGCCFGRPTNFPVALRFPPGADVYRWQVEQGLIPALAPHTVAVHPLQLYFGLLGLVMYMLGRHWQRTKRFDGEVWVKCCFFFFAGTFLLEFLRPYHLHLNLMLTATVALVTAIVVVVAHARETISTAVATAAT